LRPLSRLIPVGRGLIVWLRRRRMAHFWPITWLRCRRTVRFRLAVWLRRPVGASGIVHWMDGRRNGRWLSRGTIHWRVIRRSCRFGRYDGAVTKRSRLRSSRDCWLAMVYGSPLLRIRAGSLRMLSLNRYRRNMSLTCRRGFFRPGTRADPTTAAVVADPVHRGAVDNSSVVNVVNYGDVYVVHRTVVEKVSVIPTSTLIAFSVVAVPVTNPAIETDMRTPVAIVEDISVAAPTPIGWSPQETDFRSHYPCTRHPVIIAEIVGVSPVSRCPEIAIAWTKRLVVDR